MLLEFSAANIDNYNYPEFIYKPITIFKDPEAAIQIRTMSLAELIETRQNWLIPEGWPGIKYTLGATYANDPQGFYLLEKNGEKIASISVVVYPDINFAYIGFYLVTKPFRGKGYGKLLITKAIEYAVKSRGVTTFALNCVESAVPMYESYGFKVAIVDEFWKNTVTANKLSNVNNCTVLSEIDKKLFSELVNFDISILGANRENFLKCYLFKPCTKTVIAYDAGVIKGYGVISEREPAIPETNKSYKIAPLYANDANTAKEILTQLLVAVKPSENAYLETPGNNSVAANMMAEFGFEKIGVQPKFYKGIAPSFAADKMYCYNSVAIGG